MTTTTITPAAKTPARLWQEDLKRRIACSTAALETTTVEFIDVIPLIHTAARELNFSCFVWDIARGFRCDSVAAEPLNKVLGKLATDMGCSPDFNDALSVLRVIPKLPLDALTPGKPHALFCLMNFFEFFEDVFVRQEFENLLKYGDLANEHSARPIHIIQAPYSKQHPQFRGVEAVRHLIEPLPLPLPDIAELRAGPVQHTINTAMAEGHETDDFSEPHLLSLASACVGLPRFRAEAQLYYAAALHGSVTPGMAGIVSNLVAKELASTGTMEIVKREDIVEPEDLAGIDNALKALDLAALKYTDAAKVQCLDQPKGLYLCGLEGSGKSACAGAASKIFERKTGRPWKVIRVKMPAFYGGLYGETESRWFEFEQRVLAMGECILICDEFDKVFGGVTSRDSGSGVEKSLFGLWLAWMGDPGKRGQCFPLLAMNDPTSIPPEALREGRLDGGFYFDLPDAKTREAIARIHFAKRLKRIDRTLDDLGWSDTEWEMLGIAMDGYLPGEIETLVSHARDVAFDPTRICLPTFNQTMKLVTARVSEREADTEATADHNKRMEAVADLKRRCRAKGARPVYSPPTAVVTKPDPMALFKPERTRLGLPRTDGLN